MRKRTICLLLCVFAAPAAAQDSTITLWKREVLNSAKLKEQRAIYVTTPEGYQAGTSRYPVLVLLDAEDRAQFNLAVANVAFLADRGAIPKMIVVGIANGKDRTHDMTPVATSGRAKNFATAGGVGMFADFIVDEVMPLVRAKYRTLPTTVLAGHSFGGLVALEVAANKPGVFSGVIAMSPSLWWNDSSGVVEYSNALAKAAKGERVFVTHGGLEPDIDRTTAAFSQRMDSLKPALIAFGHQRYPGRLAQHDAGSESRRRPAIHLRAGLGRETAYIDAGPRHRLCDADECICRVEATLCGRGSLPWTRRALSRVRNQ